MASESRHNPTQTRERDSRFYLYNIFWRDDYGDVGDIAWEAGPEEGDALLVVYEGTNYEITPGDTALEFVYWEKGTTVFVGTNDETAMNNANYIPLVRNITGQVDVAWGSNTIDNTRIVKDAVTKSIYGYAAGSAVLLVGTWSDMMSREFTTTGGALKIDCSLMLASQRILEGEPGEDQYAYFGVFRDAVCVWESEKWCWIGKRDYAESICFTLIDIPVAGTYTYKFRGKRGDVANMTAYGWNRSLVIQEFKK